MTKLSWVSGDGVVPGSGAHFTGLWVQRRELGVGPLAILDGNPVEKRDAVQSSRVYFSRNGYPIFLGCHGSQMNATEDFVSVRAFCLDLVNARLVRVELEGRKRQAIALDSCTECDGPL